MKITVEQRHIDAAINRNPSACAVAQALYEVTPSSAWEDIHYFLSVEREGLYSYDHLDKRLVCPWTQDVKTLIEFLDSRIAPVVSCPHCPVTIHISGEALVLVQENKRNHQHKN